MCKHFLLAGVAGIAALSLFSCKKDQQPTADQLALRSPNGAAVTQAAQSDELDAILKDLAPETYLLAFEGLPANKYITRSIYGDLSEETQFGAPDPSPALVKIGYREIPFRKIWIKTCPTMIPPYDIAKRVAELARKADSKTFADLAIVELNDKQQLLATKTFLAAAGQLQPDAIDSKVIGDLPLDKFRIALPAGNGLPYFTRGFYGTMDITQSAAAGARVTNYVTLKWEDVLRRRFPNMIGCFDPEILKDLRSRLTRFDSRFDKFGVEEVAGGAVLGM